MVKFFSEFFPEIFPVVDTSGSMIPLSVPEIEGGSPERDGGEEEGEGLVLEYSSSWMLLLKLTRLGKGGTCNIGLSRSLSGSQCPEHKLLLTVGPAI